MGPGGLPGKHDCTRYQSRSRETPILFDDDGLAEDRELEYLVSSWFPKGEVSLIGAPSGAGKTSFGLNLLETLRNGREVWGHPAKARDYRLLTTIEASGALSARLSHLVCLWMRYCPALSG